MWQIVLMIHVLIAVALIGLVLLQHGKGADIGAAFGSGASQTLFGSQGSGSFLSKITLLLAACFFATSLILGHIASHSMKNNQQLIGLPATTQTVAPVKSVPTPAAPISTQQGER